MFLIAESRVREWVSVELSFNIYDVRGRSMSAYHTHILSVLINPGCSVLRFARGGQHDALRCSALLRRVATHVTKKKLQFIYAIYKFWSTLWEELSFTMQFLQWLLNLLSVVSLLFSCSFATTFITNEFQTPYKLNCQKLNARKLTFRSPLYRSRLWWLQE